MKIAVVDDHDLVREGLNAVLKNNGITDVDKFGLASELLSKLDRGTIYDCYLIDIELPDLDGFQLIDLIRKRYKDAKIIVSTVHDEIWTLRKLLAANVDGIIYKQGEGKMILEALDSVTRGNPYYCDEALKALKLEPDDTSYPSERELEVLNLIARGKTSREIAAALFVTDNTIESHRRALFTKLGAVNVADLIVKAIAGGYIRKGLSK